MAVTFPEGLEAAVFRLGPGEGEGEDEDKGETARLPPGSGEQGSRCSILRPG